MREREDYEDREERMYGRGYRGERWPYGQQMSGYGPMGWNPYAQQQMGFGPQQLGPWGFQPQIGFGQPFQGTVPGYGAAWWPQQVGYPMTQAISPGQMPGFVSPQQMLGGSSSLAAQGMGQGYFPAHTFVPGVGIVPTGLSGLPTTTGYGNPFMTPYAQSTLGQPLAGAIGQAGINAFGQPIVGQNAFGQPIVGQTQFGQPIVGQNAFGQPIVGQNVFGQPIHNVLGQPILGQNVLGQPMLGQNVLGQHLLGQNVLGQLGTNLLGQPVLGTNVLGQPVIGTNVLGQPVIGQNALAQSLLAQSLLGQNVLGQIGHPLAHVAPHLLAQALTGQQVHPLVAQQLAAQQLAGGIAPHLGFGQVSPFGASGIYGANVPGFGVQGMPGMGYGFGGEMGRGERRQAQRYQQMMAQQPWQTGSWGWPYGQMMERQSLSEMRARAPRGYKRSDERVLEDICERIIQEEGIDASEVEVDVKNGDVNLKGVVDERWVKRAIEDICDQVSGVKDVQNLLRVRREEETRGERSEATSQKSKQTQRAAM